MRGGQRSVTVTRQEHCRACSGSGRLHVGGDALPAVPRRRRASKSARGHMVFSKPCAQCGGTGRQRADALSGVRRPAGRDADRDAHDQRAGRAWPTARASACRARATPAGTAASTATCYITVQVAAASAVPARRRRSAPGRAGRGSRSGARREDRRAVARRAGAAARAARHAVGPAVPAARARRAVGARRPARRSGRRSAAGAAAACSTSDRRSCCASSDGSMARTSEQRLVNTKDTKDTKNRDLRPW